MDPWSLLDDAKTDMELKQRATNKAVYKGFNIERKDPYGLWYIQNQSGAFTSLDMAEREVDRQISLNG